MKVIVLLLFSLILMFNTYSQDSATQSIEKEKALENILKLSMDISICDKQENSIWDLNSTKLTIPGRPVTMKLEGKSIRINGSFTPYYSGKILMILAQTQVYLSPPLVAQSQYYSSFKTLTVSPGEVLHYFPLGQGGAKLNLENQSSDDDIITGQLVPEKPPATEKEKEEDKKSSLYYILIKLQINPYVSESESETESP